MDLTALSITLSSYGTVDYCGYNGQDLNKLIVVIVGFESTSTNINNYNTTADIEIISEFPTIEHFGLENNVLKTVYSK